MDRENTVVDTWGENERALFRSALAEWYEITRRPLPWRTHPSLYGTVVSEFMAQQTRIATMLPYFERWLARFPDFESLAAALPDDVLKHWEGLGYYSRARNLHKLAARFVSMARKPATPAEWEELPGVGPYTAAAITSIALDFPAAVVDGNVARILARLTKDERSFAGNSEAVNAFRQLAETLLDAAHPGRHNEAMMELGALVCVPGRPECGACPVAKFCKSAGTPEAEFLPKITRKETVKVALDRVLALRNGAILLSRAPEDAPRLAGQYELPLAKELGWTPLGKPVTSRTRSITHQRITERIFRLPEGYAVEAPGAARLHLIALAKLDGVTISGPHRRWIGELLGDPTNQP